MREKSLRQTDKAGERGERGQKGPARKGKQGKIEGKISERAGVELNEKKEMENLIRERKGDKRRKGGFAENGIEVTVKRRKRKATLDKASEGHSPLREGGVSQKDFEFREGGKPIPKSPEWGKKGL